MGEGIVGPNANLASHDGAAVPAVALRRHSPEGGAQTISGMIRSATMFATLIIGLIAGPAVSL